MERKARLGRRAVKWIEGEFLTVECRFGVLESREHEIPPCKMYASSVGEAPEEYLRTVYCWSFSSLLLKHLEDVGQLLIVAGNGVQGLNTVS